MYLLLSSAPLAAGEEGVAHGIIDGLRVRREAVRDVLVERTQAHDMAVP